MEQTQQTQQPEIIEYKGKEFNVAQLSEEGQHAYFQCKDVRQAQSELQFKHSQLDMSGKGFNSILEREINVYIDAQAPAEQSIVPDAPAPIHEAPATVEASTIIKQVTEDVPVCEDPAKTCEEPKAPVESCETACDAKAPVADESAPVAENIATEGQSLPAI